MAESKAWVMIPKLRDSTDDEVNIVLDMHPLVLCKECKHCNEDTMECEIKSGWRGIAELVLC